MKEERAIIILMLVFVIFTGIILVAKGRVYHRILLRLRSIQLRDVIELHICAKSGMPCETPFKFPAPDRMIQDFLESLSDLHPYSPNRDSIASTEYIWFLEIVTASYIVRISCVIPSGKGDIMVGKFGTFGTFTTYYGSFQSQLLYKWYQKYSHRWLEPEEEKISIGRAAP